MAAFLLPVVLPVFAEEEGSSEAVKAAAVAPRPQLSTYEDPVGFFRVDLPKSWFRVRPTAEGDLPNAEGKGRRGARIFSSGDVSNPYAAKVASVERYPATLLLGGQVPRTGSPDTWPKLVTAVGGKVEDLVDIVVNQRDAETAAMGKSMTTRLLKDSVAVSDTTLTFAAVTEVPVMRPDLLEEQTGRREIRRLSLFRGEMRAAETMGIKNSPEQDAPRPIITALWTSVEESDYKEPAFGAVVDAIVASFDVK